MWEMQALGLAEFDRSLDALADGLDHPEVFWEGGGAREVGADIRRNFEQGGRPVKWPDITAKSRARRKKDKTGGPLVDTGALEDAASADHAGVAGSLFGVHGDTLTVGSDLVYAATQEYGDMARNVPARSYEAIAPEDEVRLSRSMDDDWLHRLLAAMG